MTGSPHRSPPRLSSSAAAHNPGGPGWSQRVTRRQRASRPAAGVPTVKASARASAAAVPGAATPAGDGFDRARSLSLGDAIGLHRIADPLDLRSGSVLVIDRDSGQVL